MHILNDTYEEAKSDAVATVSPNRREDVVKATCHTNDMEDAVEVAEKGTQDY